MFRSCSSWQYNGKYSDSIPRSCCSLLVQEGYKLIEEGRWKDDKRTAGRRRRRALAVISLSRDQRYTRVCARGRNENIFKCKKCSQKYASKQLHRSARNDSNQCTLVFVCKTNRQALSVVEPSGLARKRLCFEWHLHLFCGADEYYRQAAIAASTTDRLYTSWRLASRVNPRDSR